MIESFRQHWESVHPSEDAPNWRALHENTLWMLGVSEDEVARFEDTAGGRILNSFTDKSWQPGEFDYNKESKEKKGMSRLSDIEARLRELEKEAARYARFDKTDPWPVGAVVTYTWTERWAEVSAERRSYTYAVLKASNGKWYWTGEVVIGRRDGDYDTLVEHLADAGVSNIRVALPEDFKPLFVEDVVGDEAATKVSEFLADPSTGVTLERPAKRADG